MPLQYPAKTIDLKTVGITLGSTAVFVGVVIGAINIFNDNKYSVDRPSEIATLNTTEKEDNNRENVMQVQTQSYSRAVDLLSNKNTADVGLSMLKDLADKKDYKSAFLLSRLYFDSAESVKIGAFADSVALFRINLGMPAQNREAHRLLKNAVALNSEDYKSLFELGCDYKSKKRGAIFNTDSAYIYLNKARQLAIKAGDKEYEQAISKRMINLKPVKDE